MVDLEVLCRQSKRVEMFELAQWALYLRELGASLACSSTKFCPGNGLSSVRCMTFAVNGSVIFASEVQN